MALKHGQEYKTIKLPTGRDLTYATYGVQQPKDGTLTIFYFHGFLSSRYEGSGLHEPALARNIRIVAADRPGMGHSTFQTNRKLDDWPLDVLALADAPDISVKQFAVMGTSGGGAYALSCCHGIPKERLLAAGVICGLMPTKLGSTGMEFGLRMMFMVAPWSTGIISWLIDKAIARHARADLEHFKAALDKGAARWPEADKEAWNANERGVRDMLAQSIQGALVEPSSGTQGAAWEANIFGSPWPFELKDVRMDKGKLILWHGTADQSCPYAAAQKAAASLAGSELRSLEGEGHISTAMHSIEDVLDTLQKQAAA
jgi:pimeloyl-ACP methyl ester carboxylesterase